jgi:predicted transcriptional regulator
MKVKQLTIGIKSAEASLREFTQTVKRTQAGKAVHEAKEEVNFVSLEAFNHFFTPKRMALLKLIHHQHPGSVYALAKMADRDLKNVQDDVALLARVGLVELEQSRKGREKIIPHVDYETLRFEIAV